MCTFRIYFRFSLEDNNGEETFTPLYGETEQEWYHIIITHDHGTSTIFVNLKVKCNFVPLIFLEVAFELSGALTINT